MTLKELRAILATVQKRLRLQDWRITIRWAKEGELPENEDANIKPVLQHRIAAIIIRPLPRKPDPAWVEPRDIIEDVYHETLHIWTAPFDRPEGDIHEEQMCCALAKAFAESHPK